MDAFRQQLLRIQQQLGSLSASQKMLTLSLVVIMVMTLFWLARFAGSTEMEMLLDRPVAGDQLVQMKDVLRGRGIPFEVRGDRIFVPADRRFEAISDLGFREMLPEDTTDVFAEMVSQMSAWDSQSKTNEFFNQAKQKRLENIIRRWPDVADARVMIDPTNRPRVVGGIEPTAAVDIRTTGKNGGNKRLAKAAARLVASSQAGLKLENVSVSIDAIPVDLGDGSNNVWADGELMANVARWETHVKAKILEQLAHIGGGVYVSVVVDINTVSSRSQETSVDPDKIVNQVQNEETETTETTGGATGFEPGVAVNTGGLEVGNGGASASRQGATSTSERTRTEFFIETSRAVVEKHAPSGDPTPRSASVQVPRSYIVRIWQNLNGTTETPSEEQLADVRQREIERIKQTVRNASGIDSIENISVQTYIESMPMLAAASEATAAGGAMGTVEEMAGSYGKEIAVGVLALVSLFMMGMMVRKSAANMPTLPVPIFDEPELPQPKEKVEDVSESLAAMFAQEMDEDAVEAKQMVEQVAGLVKDNPDAAANLVKRWLKAG